MSRDEQARELRKQIGSAISDPGATQGYKGERTLTEWQLDAVMPIVLEALRGASGGGKPFSRDDENGIAADAAAGDGALLPCPWNTRAPDQFAENAKSSGEVPQWQPRIGDEVRASEHLLMEYGEWRDQPLWVAGLQACDRGGINVSVSEDWPRNSRSLGLTDGFYINRPDRPNDLVPAALARSGKGEG